MKMSTGSRVIYVVCYRGADADNARVLAGFVLESEALLYRDAKAKKFGISYLLFPILAMPVEVVGVQSEALAPTVTIH